MDQEPPLPDDNAAEASVSAANKDGTSPGGRVVAKEIKEEMSSSYIDYAMSVIVGRALPDVRDGLKPVQRRILFAMHDMGMLHNKPSKKSARIVGEVLGKYHPHGDTAVYDTMVRMAQGFSLRYPLIDGQGNFGSVDGDNAAAMRYTEARLTKAAEEILVDIDKDTIDFVQNFDGSLKEPSVLPAKLPNLLINGASGIAVGMATNIPPHNVREITDGIIALIDDPDITIDGIMEHVTGPDFPTQGIIQGTSGIRQAFHTGRGRVTIKSRAEIEEHKGRERIIITEIPYQVNKAQLIEQIADLVRDKRLIGISDIRDESDRDGMRIVIDLKKDTPANVILKQLQSYTRMTTTFGVNMVTLVDGQPRTLSLKEMMQEFIAHRQRVVRRRTQFELDKAEKRAHIVEGLIKALDSIDEVVQKIKKSPDAKAAEAMLCADYLLSPQQAKAILDMKLQKLASLEQQKLRDEYDALKLQIMGLRAILEDESKILAIIKEETVRIRQDYGDERRTVIEEGDDEGFVIEELIKEENVVVTVSHAGYIKRISLENYHQQGRGGVGIKAAATSDGDFIEHVFVASTHSSILFFTNKGRIYWQKVYNIPEASRQARGKAVVNLVQLGFGEKIQTFVSVPEFREDRFLCLFTKKGIIKKSSLAAYSRPRQGGIIAITLDEADELIDALISDGQKQLLVATKHGMAAKFHESDARAMGRASRGVRAITLKDDDEVVDAIIADDAKTVLTVTEHGYGKRSLVAEYRLIRRGGSGVINIQCTDRNGCVVAVMSVDEDDEVMFISKEGIIIRTSVEGISTMGRNTQGVRLMRRRGGDQVVSAAKAVGEKEEPDEA